MTYDVQRYSAYHSGDLARVGLWADAEGAWVLAADAEAHEQAAVEAVMDDWRTLYEAQAKASRGAISEVREQAIRDCIAVVEGMTIETVGNSAATVDQAQAVLRALLDDGERHE